MARGQVRSSPAERRRADARLPLDLSEAVEGGIQALRQGDCQHAFRSVIASTAIGGKLASLTGQSSDRAEHLRREFARRCVRAPGGALDGARGRRGRIR